MNHTETGPELFTMRHRLRSIAAAVGEAFPLSAEASATETALKALDRALFLLQRRAGMTHTPAKAREWYRHACGSVGGERVSRLAAAKRQQAERLLREALADGPRTSADLRRMALKLGISAKTLVAAKTAIGARSIRQGRGRIEGWKWELPAPQQPTRPPTEETAA